MKNKPGKYPYFCLFFYLIIWFLLALSPRDRFTWFLENLLVFIFVPSLIFTFKKFRLSNISYTTITIFLILHSIGAHYTYSEVPFVKSIFDFVNFQRDNYDRLVHFSFGLLMVYPAREVITRSLNLNAFWRFYIPLIIIISSSASYEIIEMVTAMIVQPENAIAWLGIQGDPFDAEKDMLMAASGALITSILSLSKAYTKKWH